MRLLTKTVADINRIINLIPEKFFIEIKKIEQVDILKKIALGLQAELKQLEFEFHSGTLEVLMVNLKFDDISRMLQMVMDRMAEIVSSDSENHSLPLNAAFFEFYPDQLTLSFDERLNFKLSSLQFDSVYPIKNLSSADKLVFKEVKIKWQKDLEIVFDFLKKIHPETIDDKKSFKNKWAVLAAVEQVCVFADYFKAHYSIEGRAPADLTPLLKNLEMISWMERMKISLNQNLPYGFSNEFLSHAPFSAFGAFNIFGVHNPEILRAITYHQENRLVPEMEKLTLFELFMYVTTYLKDLSNPRILEFAINDLRSDPGDARFYLERLLFAILADLIDKKLAGSNDFKVKNNDKIFSEVHPKTLSRIFKKQSGFSRFAHFIVSAESLRENVFQESDFLTLLPLYEQMNAGRTLHVNKVKQWLILRDKLMKQWDMNKETQATLKTATDYLEKHFSQAQSNS